MLFCQLFLRFQAKNNNMNLRKIQSCKELIDCFMVQKYNDNNHIYHNYHSDPSYSGTIMGFN